MDQKARLKALYQTYEDIRIAMLGVDWETRLELKDLQTKVAKAITDIKESAKL